ncbi:MAG: hypothetical protein DRP27_07130, partial [Thermotogae bacterium]
MFRFKKLSTLITTVASLAVIALIGVALVVLYFTAADKMKDRAVEPAKSPVELVYSIVEQVYQQEKAGKLSHEEAVQKVKELVSPLRFQGDNYVFIIDSNYVLPVHPTLEGKDGSTIQDKNPDEKKRVYVIRDLADGARKNGEFILEYYWDKPGQKKVVPKITYAKFFEPYQWTIGAGIYADDIQKDVMALLLPILYAGIAAVVIVIVILYFIARGIGKAAGTLETAVGTIAGGDLTHTFELNRSDELGRVGNAIKKMIAELKEVLTGVIESSKESNTLAQNLAAAAEEQGAAAQEVTQAFERATEEFQNISATLQEVTSGVEEVAASAQNVSKSAQELAESSEVVAQSVKNGVNAIDVVSETVRRTYRDVQETAKQVEELANHAKNIGVI